MNETPQNPDNSATSRAVFAVGLVTFATIIIFCWTYFAFRFEPKSPVKGFHSPVIALELAKTAKEFVQIAGDKGDLNRAIIQKGIWADYVFIAAYWAMFVCLGALIKKSKYSCAVLLSVLVGACATGAAVFDIVENVRIGKTLQLTFPDMKDAFIQTTRTVSLCKWALIFAATLFLAPVFLWRNDCLTYLGALMTLSALTGFAGMLYNPAIEWASILMGLCFVRIAMVFTFSSEILFN